jgi:hypothetical protein
MRSTTSFVILGFAVTAALSGLSACDRPADPAETPAPAVPPPATPAAGGSPAASTTATPNASAQMPAVATAAVSGVPANRAAEPALSSMKLAEPPQKLGAPVDLRYQFEGEIRAGQPVIVHLAAVPRVAGSNLVMSVKKESGVTVMADELKVQKVGASTPYRQDLSVTKAAGGPSALRVLVMMETPEGSSHSWFTVPLDSAPATEKQQATKLE